mgnify:CR=1 FL=1
MSKQTDFIKKIAPLAIKYSKKYKFPFPSVCIGQCIHESGWGTSSYAVKYNNYFGLKNNHEGISDKFFIGSAIEEVNGKDVKYDGTAWCYYDTLEQGVEGYFKYLTVWKHYAPAFTKPTWQECLRHISKTYATRSNYYEQIEKIINDYNLYIYDKKVKKVNRKEEKANELAEQFFNETEKGFNELKYAELLSREKGNMVTMSKPFKVYNSENDALKDRNGIDYQAGIYFIYKLNKDKRCINLTRDEKVKTPGGWICKIE